MIKIKEEAIKLAGIMIIENNKILLVKQIEGSDHLNNTYGIPSGHIEPGETEEDCAIRELKEETNLDTDKENLIKLPYNYVARIKRKNGETKLFSMVNFNCNKYSGDLKSSSDTEPEWISLNDLNKINLLPNVEKMIKDSLKH